MRGYEIPAGLMVVGILAGAACVEPLDVSRPPRPQRSLGEEVYLALCNRVAAADYPDDVSGSVSRSVCEDGEAGLALSPRLQVLSRERERLVGSVDDAVPSNFADDLGDLLVRMLPLYDEDILQRQTRAAADVVNQLAASSAATAALERMSARQGYRPLADALGLLRPAFAYPRLQQLTKELVGLVRSGGVGEPSWQGLLTALYHELANVSSATSGSMALRRDLLLREVAALGDGRPRYLAWRDERGIVEPADQGGEVVAPFVDANHDGLADVDGAGRLVGADARPLNLPPPFATVFESPRVTRDAYGRLQDNNALVYRYRDLSQTVLAGLMHETHALLAEHPGVIFDLLAPSASLLGGTKARVHVYDDGSEQAFDGYDVARSPVVDLTYAAGSVADTPSAYWSLRLAEQLLDSNESEVAGAVDAVRKLGAWADEPENRDKALEPGTTLTDDMLEITTEIMRVPGLWEDLLAAIDTPETRRLGDIYAKYMRYKDRITYDPNDVNGPPIGSPHTPVDRSQPDTVDNRSIFQRFLHLVHDCNGARLCNKKGAVLDLGWITYPLIGSYDECELFEVDNLATFYIDATLGRAELTFKDSVVDTLSELDFLLEDLSGIDGFTRHPTPEAINRMVFAPRNAFLQAIVDPPRGADGVELEARHPGTIFAWELYDFFDNMRPIFKAFSDHGRLDLLVDLMSTMHLHWSSPASDTTQSSDPSAPAWAKQSGAVRFEELTARALTEGDIIGRLADVVHAARLADLDGTTGEDVLVDLPRQLFLPEWNEDLRLQNGSAVFVKNDGAGIVTPLAPVWLFLHGTRLLDKATDAMSPQAHTAWKGASDALAEQFLGTRDYMGGKQFTDGRARAIVQAALAFADERLVAHWSAGDVEAWADDLAPSAERALAHPAVASGLHLAQALVDTPAARTEVEAFVSYLVDALRPQATFDATLTSLADLLQVVDAGADLKPVLRQLAPLVDPEGGVADDMVTFLDRMQALDDKGVLPKLLAGLVVRRSDGSGETPLEAMIDIAAEVNRAEPGAGGPLSAEDIVAVLGALHDTLTDDTRGLERLYKLIEER